MAVAYLKYSPSSSSHGRFIQSAITGIAGRVNVLTDLLANLTTMIDGDPADSANFTLLATNIGAPDNATAKAIYDELSSLNSKFITDAPVSEVRSAIINAVAKLTV